MNIVKAQAAVEHIARQVANAMDTADRLEANIQTARNAAIAAVDAHVRALAEVRRLGFELVAAEAVLAECHAEITQTNGSIAGGAAFDATIRIEPND